MTTRHLLVLATLTAAATASLAADGARQTPLIARDALFAYPNQVNPKISPDGRWVSFLAPVDGVLNVWAAPVDNPRSAEPITEDRGRGIRSHFWAHTNRHILYLRDERGDGVWRLYRFDLARGDERVLTPDRGKDGHPVSVRIQHVSHKFPNEVVVGINDRDPGLYDLYRVNVETGELTGLELNEGFSRFYTDDGFRVLLAERATPAGGLELLKVGAEGAWETFATIDPEDRFTTGPIDFDRDGTHVYMIDSRGRDTAALTRINLETGARKTIASERDADIAGGVLIHPTEKNVQAVAATHIRRKWSVKDKSVKDDFRYLERLSDGDFSIVSRTVDDLHWIVAYDDDDGPVRYYHYDRTAQSATLLFTSQSALVGLPLAQMHDDEIRTGDRMKLVSYYTLPIDRDPKGTGRPDEPLPMVVWVHGGPWSRVTWGYDPIHQWLANRGYAVLSVNYRGSTGFGKKFLMAGHRQWGAKMSEDLIDAVQWAVSKRIADPDRIAIMGASYGGYATLMGLAQTPQQFVCGVEIAGPANLVSFLESIPTAYQPLFTSRVGDPGTEEGRAVLTERSPLTHADKIRRPLMVVQGGNDPRVPRSESDQLVRILSENDVPVSYVVFPDEGHGLERRPNRLSCFAVIEAFLSTHLGGRCQPIAEEFGQASITIPVGAEQLTAAFVQ